MGLSIHYSLHADARAPAEARRLVEQLRAAALPFAEVGEVFETTDLESDDEDLRWLLIQAHHWLLGDDYALHVPPEYVIAFTVDPGPGSEPANFGLCRYPSEYNGRPTGLDGWNWNSFCKTQYASNPTDGGLDNFLKAHLTVVKVLDCARELGILRKVVDDSGFWESRSVELLVKEIGKWNRHLAAFVGQMKDRYGDEFLAPIRDFPNFERLEAEGRDPEG